MPHPKDKQIKKLESYRGVRQQGTRLIIPIRKQPYEIEDMVVDKINELIDCYNSLMRDKE